METAVQAKRLAELAERRAQKAEQEAKDADASAKRANAIGSLDSNCDKQFRCHLVAPFYKAFKHSSRNVSRPLGVISVCVPLHLVFSLKHYLTSNNPLFLSAYGISFAFLSL